MRQHIALYVNDFTRDYGAEGEAAIRHLLETAERLAIVPHSRSAALRVTLYNPRMLTRRKFLTAAAAGAATLSTFSRLPELGAAEYDLIIAGGRVIDPSHAFDAVADVAIAGGKIAAVRPGPRPIQCGRDDRRARQAGRSWSHRHPHACGAGHGRSGDVPVPGCHVAHRRRIPGRGSHRRSRGCRESRAQSHARPDQHGEDRHPGRRRAERHQPRRRRRHQGRHRAQS